MFKRINYARELPVEIWEGILSHLDSPRQLAQALTVCKPWYAGSELIYRACCFRRWPQLAPLAAALPNVDWRRVFELLKFREHEAAVLPDVKKISSVQPVVTAAHRCMLAEWLCEVATEWQLASHIVYRAIAYLDYYLSTVAVQQLSRYQLLGLGCLRAAMGDSRLPTAIGSEEFAKQMDPSRFMHISNSSCTAKDVEDCTEEVSTTVPSGVKAGANPKMFLRIYWHRALAEDLLQPDEMHIYTLASFLLQLSLLNLECATFLPSVRAASCFSLASAYFGKEEWPVPLQAYGCYQLSDLEACRRMIADTQATMPASQLRPVWRQSYITHGYPQFCRQWEQTLALVIEPSTDLLKLLLGPDDDLCFDSPQPTNSTANMAD